MEDNEVPWPYAYSDEKDILCLMKYSENESLISDVNSIMQKPNIADHKTLREQWCKELKSELIRSDAQKIKFAIDRAKGVKPIA
jgi:hypothetical protein